MVVYQQPCRPHWCLQWCPERNKGNNKGYQGNSKVYHPASKHTIWFCNERTNVAFSSTDCKWWFINDLAGSIDASYDNDVLTEMKETKRYGNCGFVSNHTCTVSTKGCSCEQVWFCTRQFKPIARIDLGGVEGCRTLKKWTFWAQKVDF